ncbi:MAG: phosphoethanolamine transferase [Rickettsiales bacterium]|jgi:glucan phosphoethanolaminetransferase (alkaline phosphatase superfamily)|nr:phosphoethanolamine transferase [Rickettsiales bacterium]
MVKKLRDIFSNIKNRALKILENKVCLWLFLSISTLACFLLPSLFYSLIEKNYAMRAEYGFWAMFLPLAMGMALAKGRAVCALLIFFVFMELIQFGHLVYFGLPLNPFIIETILSEAAEITESGLGIILKIWYFPFLVLLPYGLLAFLYKKTSKNRKQFHLALIFILALLSYFPQRVLRKESAINNMMPVNTRVSLYNDFRSFSGFFFNRLPKIIGKENFSPKKEYADYSFEKSDVKSPVNVIVIMGESASRAHMSLFGYERETTPLLEKMSREDKNFIYKEAFSSGIMTLISVNMFFNIQREPDNIKHLLSRNTDMFMLAKNNGFRTAYFSAQMENLMTGISANYVDFVMTKEDMANKIKKRGEIYLADYFRKNAKSQLLGGDKNFLVIHQRNIHSPYKHNYELEQDRFNRYSLENTAKGEYMVNGYDNAMLYNDYFLTELLGAIREETKGTPTYVFFVSDHSEALGEGGRFGHSFLAREVAEIPFFATFYWTEDNELKKEIGGLFYPTHYEIGKIIAKKLGYKIINPNEEEGIFFINGVNIFGIAGHITITKDAGSGKVELK